MIRDAGFRVALVAAALLLGACVGQRTKPVRADAAALANQAAREAALATMDDWSLHGRLGVSDGHDSGSGSLEWTQHASAFRFSVHAPVTGKTWVLSGDDGHARLDGLREQEVDGRDAASLLERELGWKVPVADLRYWVRGQRAPGAADIEFRDDGLPAMIAQGGWTVRYLDYDVARDPPMPSKVFASRGSARVRVAISQWSFDD
jgi:outer membrane lipoprotein LolB